MQKHGFVALDVLLVPASQTRPSAATENHTDQILKRLPLSVIKGIDIGEINLSRIHFWAFPTGREIMSICNKLAYHA